LTRDDLRYKVGGGDERERAIRNLSIVGLLWCEGDNLARLRERSGLLRKRPLYTARRFRS
jgi:hypothetical protein